MKLFVVRKYVFAKNVSDAIKREKTQSPDDIWVDEDWKKDNIIKCDGFIKQESK